MRLRNNIVMVFCVLSVLGGCKNEDREKDEYVRIAKATAQKEGASLERSDIYFDENNVAWNKTLDDLKTNSPDYATRFNVLTGENYQAVKIYPKKELTGLTLGGVLWVLIDKETKEVILFHGEK